MKVSPGKTPRGPVLFIWSLLRADYKVASILDTGYGDDTYDGVVAHAVIDPLSVVDAQKAIKELLRITIANGLV